MENRKTGWLIPILYSLIPGYPELKPFDDGSWDRLWHVYSLLVQNGLHVGASE
jgi:hypothetical protein